MKQIQIAVVGSLLLAAAPLYAANEGALSGATGLALKSSDGSGGSFRSDQQGTLGTSGASSTSNSDGALASPSASPLDGYLDVGSGDFAKSRAAFLRAENRGTRTMERAVQHAAASEQTTAPSATGSAAATVNRVESAAADGPSNFASAMPGSVGGIDVTTGLHALSLRGSAH